MLEIQGKFPSSEMVQKLANALSIDPTELFLKETDPATALKNAHKATIEGIGEAVNQLIKDFFADQVKNLNEKPEEKAE
jgi:hypothetical protein